MKPKNYIKKGILFSPLLTVVIFLFAFAHTAESSETYSGFNTYGSYDLKQYLDTTVDGTESFDPILKELYANDGNTLDYFGKEWLSNGFSSDPVQNAVSAYRQIYEYDDDYLLMIAYDHISGKVNVEENPILSRYHHHTDRYLSIKEQLLQSITEEEANSEITQKLIFSLRSNFKGLENIDPIQDSGIPDITSDSSYNHYSLLSKSQELIFHQALRNAMRTYATLEMYRSRTYFNEWMSQTETKLKQVFCSESNNSAYGTLSDTYPDDYGIALNRCMELARLTMQEFNLREYFPLESAQKWISDNIKQTNQYLIAARKRKLNGAEITRDHDSYLAYINSYASTAVGPGIAILRDPLKSFVGDLLMPEDIGWEISYHNTPSLKTDEIEYHDHLNKTSESLKSAQRDIIMAIRDLEYDYVQSKIDFKSLSGQRTGANLSDLIENRNNDITDLIRFAPNAVAQIWYKHPYLTPIVANGVSRCITNLKKEEKIRSTAMWGLLIVSGVLILTGVGSWLGATLATGLTATGVLTTVATTATVLGLFVSLFDVGYSYRETSYQSLLHKKYENAILTENGSNLPAVEQAYQGYKEARLALVFAIGGTLFDAGAMKTLVTSSRGAAKTSHLLAAAEGTMDRVRFARTKGLFKKLYPKSEINGYFKSINGAQRKTFENFMSRAGKYVDDEDELLNLLYNVHKVPNNVNGTPSRVKKQALVELKHYLMSNGIDEKEAKALTRSLSDDGILGSPVADNVINFLSHSGRKSIFDVPPDLWNEGALDLRRIIIAHPEEFDFLLSNVSKQDLLGIAKAVKAGEVGATPEQIKRLDALVALTEDVPESVLWPSTGRSAYSLQSSRPAWKMLESEGKLGATIAGVDTSGITDLEKNIVLSALGKVDPASVTRKIGKGSAFKRFWSPVYKPVKKILAFNNLKRTALDTCEETEEVLSMVAEHGRKIGIESSELSKVDIARVGLDRYIRKIKGDMDLVYTPEIAPNVVPGDDLDIYKIAGKIDEHNLLNVESSTDFVEISEDAMDKVDEVLQATHKKRGLPPRAARDYYSPELKIRHRQASHQIDEGINIRKSALNEDSKLIANVDYQWQETEVYFETVTRTDSKGRSYTTTEMRTRSVTRYGNKDITLTYEDIIESRCDLVGHSTSSPGFSGYITGIDGVDDIIANTEKIAAQENDFTNAFNRFRSITTDAIGNHSDNAMKAADDIAFKKSTLEELRKLKIDIETRAAKAKEYASLSDDEIMMQWKMDDPDNFRKRNKGISDSLERLHFLTDVYEEQFKRGMKELIPIPALPDYSNELSRLRNRMIRNYLSKTAIGAGTFVSGACADWQGLDRSDPLYEICMDLWNNIQDFIGLQEP